jgi:hypothetical protein
MVPNIAQYLSPQALLAITIVGPLVPSVFEQFKPLIDAKMDSTKVKHDLTIKGTVALIDVLGVFLFMWLFEASGDIRTFTWGAVGALISYFMGQTVYATTRGPVPITPTAKYVDTLMSLHGDLLAKMFPPTVSLVATKDASGTQNT